MELKDFPTAMIAIGMVVLIAAGASIALDDFKDNLADDVGVSTVTNESIASVGTSVTLTSITGATWLNTFTSLYANRTGSYELVTTGNYTLPSTGVDTRGGAVVTLNTAYSGNNTLASYTYKDSDKAINITFVGLDAELNATDLMDTIGTILGVSALIGLIVAAFLLMKR